MPIPAFDANNVLPPHAGDPRDIGQLSPYPCTSAEFCLHFATSPDRIAILYGYLQFRELLGLGGFISGFQWLDGSFLENIEAESNRAPGDLDIITIYVPTDAGFNGRVAATHPILTDHNQIKAAYRMDHYFLDTTRHPILTVELTRYWVGLFSHRRDGVWKGMLRIDLNTPLDDSNAKATLGLP